MLVRRFEDLLFEVKKRLGRVAAERTRELRSFERLRHQVDVLEGLWHEYRKIRRKSTNLFGRVI